ncbi:ABC transporter ATP-binding protein [Xylanibacillus composti]|nr:ABC transporter ATP-binding protein [Xylanibacillus composti]
MRQRSRQMRQAFGLLVWLSRQTKPAILGMVLLLLVSPILNWATVMLTKHFIDSLSGEELRTMLQLAAAMGAIAMAIAIVGRLQGFLGDRLSLDMAYRMEQFLLEMIKPEHVTLLETPQFQQDLNILKNSLFKINSFIQAGLSFLHQIILIVIYTWMLLPYSVLAAALVLACSLTVLAQVWKQTSRQEKLFQSISQTEMEARHLGDLVLQPAAQKEMLVFAAKTFLMEKWRRAAHSVTRVRKQFLRKDLSWELLVEIVQPLGFFGIQLILLPKVARGQMSVGDYVAMSAAAGYLAASWKTFFHSLAPFKGVQLFVQRFFRFQDTYFPQAPQRGKRLGKLRRLELNEMSFTYPARNEPVLRDIHLALTRGEMIALVGENGSGKSTLAKVIAGLHHVDRGRMFVNGTDLCDVERTSYYARVSIVNQDYMRYPFSVYENIALASPTAEVKERADGFLQDFPELVPAQLLGQLDTVIGHQYLNARQLSGGQWQRVAIARALYKEADLLVLDEATAELDPGLELPLIERLRSLRRGKMTVLVTHSMHVARRADCIYVLHNGTIVESGSHERLIAADGLYSRMWERQNEAGKKGDVQSVFA